MSETQASTAADVRLVDPNTLTIIEERATASYDEGQREALAENIRLHGIKVPIDVVDVDGALVITDGLNRTLIALELGLPTVPVRVVKGTMKDAMLDNLAANQLRGKNKPGEMAALVVKLDREHGTSPEEIAAKTGLSASYIKKLLTLGNLSPHVLAALDAGAVKLGVALEIARLPGDDAQNRTLVLSQSYGWTIEQAERMVDGILREMEKPLAEQQPIELVRARGIPCMICAKEHEPHMMTAATLCHGCWGMAVATVRDVMRVDAPGASQ